jgi:hypothetical protein
LEVPARAATAEMSARSKRQLDQNQLDQKRDVR